MKRENIKKNKVLLKILKTNGFRSPYQIIADSSFIKAINKRNIRPSAFLDLFKTDPKYFMTKCTYELHKPHLVTKDFSGSCEIIKCEHEKADVNCVYNFINEENKHHYILATNNLFYINKLKTSKYIPIIRLSKSNIKLECNQLDASKKEYVADPVGKKELRKLKKMYEKI